MVKPEELKHLRRARDLIDREYARPLDVPALARAAYMSPAHFSRQFRAAYGETPYSYLMTRRIERAKTLLRRGDLRLQYDEGTIAAMRALKAAWDPKGLLNPAKIGGGKRGGKPPGMRPVSPPG